MQTQSVQCNQMSDDQVRHLYRVSRQKEKHGRLSGVGTFGLVRHQPTTHKAFVCILGDLCKLLNKRASFEAPGEVEGRGRVVYHVVDGGYCATHHLSVYGVVLYLDVYTPQLSASGRHEHS